MAHRDPVATFQRFLRIRTVSAEGPHGTYADAVAYLQSLLVPLGLETTIVEVSPGRPVLIGTWKGSRPELPSLLLNSHYDVVPCNEAQWHTDPFAAILNDDDEIVARGTQGRDACWTWLTCRNFV